ncbi:MFS transporter [Micromonospora sp. NPDC093244]|uniref:MFS transporter n=1 Tax=unclassified Micromonospora TaxID=2617518 RepID=UPI003423853B
MVATLINTFGSGLLIGSLPLYYTRVVGLSAAQVGLGLTIALTAALVMALPLGELADRRGPVQVIRALLLVETVSMLGILFIGDFISFLVASCVHLVASNALGTVEGALLRRVAGDDAPAFRSSIYAVTNVGLSLGLIPSGIAIQLGTANAYRTLIVINLLSFLVAWLVLDRLPRYKPIPRPATGPRWIALRDKPYVTFALLKALMHPQFYVLTLLLPLWVVDKTNAPRWTIPVSLAINTVFIILLQVRLGSQVQTIRQGGLAWRRAGLAFLLSCCVLAVAAGLPSWAALVVVIAAVVLHSYGEIMHTAGLFSVALKLPPPHAQAQYDGFSGIFAGTGNAAAPALLLGVVLSLGVPGLIGLGVFFLLPSLLMPAVTRWGERTRPKAQEDLDLTAVDAVK